MLKFFIDFDGTITTQDVGDALFEKFGGEQCKEIIHQYHIEKISAVECFRQEAEACGIVNKHLLDEFIDAQTIDESFRAFISFCQAKGFEYYVLSDGMDYYIKRILQRFGLGEVPVYANTMNLEPFLFSDSLHEDYDAAQESGMQLHHETDKRSLYRLVPTFPHTDEVCDRCASCKRNHMLSLSGDDDILAYIGEGYSDRCPVRYADVIFAKDDLLKYCRREEIPHAEYKTFEDITQYVEKMTGGNGQTKIRLKKRRLAELARREIFAGG